MFSRSHFSIVISRIIILFYIDICRFKLSPDSTKPCNALVNSSCLLAGISTIAPGSFAFNDVTQFCGYLFVKGTPTSKAS